MKLTEDRRSAWKPAKTAVEKATYELNNSAGWLYVAIQNRMDEYIGTPTADLTTVTNCIDFLESQIRVLHLVNRELCGGKS